jgi:WD40 repeat protein
MFAPDRRTFLSSAGCLSLGTTILDAVSDAAMAVVATSGKPGAGLKPHDGDGLLALPAGAVRRLGDQRMRILSNINALQFSPKGTTLVSATSGELRGWDPRTGRVLFRFYFPADSSVDSGRLTSRDTFVLMVRLDAGGGQELRQYAFGTGKLVSRSPSTKFENHQHTAYSVDGGRLAVVHNEALCLHDTITGTEKWREPLPAQSVGDCQFFPDGGTIALASKGEVKLFAAATGKLIDTLSAAIKPKEEKVLPPGGREHDAISDLKVSADGKWLAASVGEDEEVVVFWDVKASTVKHRLKLAGKPIGFAANGFELATVYRGMATFWSVATGKVVRRFEVPREDVQLSPDGKLLAAKAGDAVILIDPTNGKHLPNSSEPPGVPTSLRFLGPNRLRGRLDQWGGWVEWDSKTGKQKLLQPPGLSGQIPIDLSVDGQVALYRREETYTAVVMATGKALRSGKGADDVNESVTTLALTPDGRLIVSPTANGLAVVADKERKEIARNGDAPGMAVVVATDGRTAAIGFRGGDNGSPVDLYDLLAGRHLRRLKLDGDPSHIAFSLDGRRLAISHDIGRNDPRGQQGTTSIYDLHSGKSVFRAAPHEEVREHVIAYSPNGRMLARLGNKGLVRIWEVHAGQIRTSIELGQEASANALAFSQEGRTLAVSVDGGPVFLWDLYAGKPLTLSRTEVERAWDNLQSSDGAKAFASVVRLTHSRVPALAFLREKVAPIGLADPTVVDQLIANLDHKEFRKREAAARSLAELGERAQDPISKALTAGPSPETRDRLEKLLAADDRRTPEQLRRLRAIEVVEMIGTPESGMILTEWAAGAPGAEFTKESAAALERLGARPK